MPVKRPAGLRVARVMSRALNAAGLFECVSWSFLDPDRLKRMGWDDPAGLITLQNPSSIERSVLRPSLIPGLLEVLAINANRQMPDARLFEVGNVFAPHRPEDGDRPAHEDLRLGIALTGLRAPRAWFTGGRDRVDVYDAKGLAELALHAAGLTDAETSVWPAEQVPAYLEPGRAARLVRGSLELGWFGEVALAAREVFDLPGPVFVAELSVTALAGLPIPVAKYEPLPRFPAVQRDLAIVVGGEVTAGEVEAAIRALAHRPAHAHHPVRRVHWRPGGRGPAQSRLEPHLPGARSHPHRRRGEPAARAHRRGDRQALPRRGPRRVTEDRMAEGLTERLEQLEKSVRRAAETITRLRKERDNLQAKVAGLEAKLQHAEGERAELTSLRQERKEVLAQVDGILKELDRLDIQ